MHHTAGEPGGAEVLPVVKFLGVLCQDLSDGSSHRQAGVTVDVDLAHRAEYRNTAPLFLNRYSDRKL